MEQVQALGDIPSLVEVVIMLAQGIGVGAVISFLFEHFEWFQNLSSEAKWRVILGISVGLPLLAQVLVEFVPADVWAAINPFWMAMAAGFLSWLGSQVAHLGRKAVEALRQR